MYKAKEQYSIVQLPISQLNKNAKTENFTIAKSTISQIPSYNFTLGWLLFFIFPSEYAVEHRAS